jgi:hypothetical protein
LSLEKADLIQIERAGATTTLEKVDGRWKVGGTKDFYVKKEVIDELSFALNKVSGGSLELVGSNQDKKAGFGTDAGIKVAIRQEGQVYDIIIGKATANFDGSYLSRPDTEKTWKAGVDLSSVFSRGEWRDDQIFSFLKERAAKIRFQYPKSQFTAERKENKWQGTLPKKFTVSDEKVNKVLEVLENLKAAKFPEQDFKAFGSPEKNGVIVQITGEQLDETLMIGNCAKDNFCYAKRGNSDNIYLISKEQKDAISKQMKDLR